MICGVDLRGAGGNQALSAPASASTTSAASASTTSAGTGNRDRKGLGGFIGAINIEWTDTLMEIFQMKGK
jgi:hypothetical protein